MPHINFILLLSLFNMLQSQRSKKLRRRNNRLRRRKGTQGLGLIESGVVRNIPLHYVGGMNSFNPENLVVDLTFTDTTFKRTDVGQPAFNFRFRASAFDVDPLLGSTSIPGFTELSSLYQAYRVRGMRIDTVITNMEAFPITVGIMPGLTDYGNNLLSQSSVAQYINSNPWSRSYNLGLSGSGSESHHFVETVSTGQVFGDIVWETDDGFAAFVTTNPANMWYWNVMGHSPSGANFTASGVVTDTRVTLQIMFYQRRNFTA